MTRLRLTLLAVLAILLACWPHQAQAGDWHVVMVIDRSGSMTGYNDPGWNSLLAPAILSDLFDEDDRFEVVPQEGYCGPLGMGCSPIVLDTRKRKDFKESLEGLPTGSTWEGPMGRAVKSLVDHEQLYDRRMFTIVYDGDQKDPSNLGQMATMERDLAATGTHSFVLAVGSSTSGSYFVDNWDDRTFATNNPDEILFSFADMFKRMLNAGDVPHGTVSPTFSVDVAPGAVEAWLVVAAEGRVTSLTESGSNPGAARVNENLHDGWNIDTPAGERGYQIVHLDQPKPGEWSFQARTTAPKVHYLLLQRFDIDLSIRFLTTPVPGVPIPFEVVPTGPSATSDLSVTVEVDGKTVEVPPAGDGTYKGEVVFDFPGEIPVTVRGKNRFVEATETDLVEVKKVEGSFDCSPLEGVNLALSQPMVISVARMSTDNRIPLDDAWFEVDGVRHSLTDDGQDPDEAATDHIYTGQFIPDRIGLVEATFFALGQGVQHACRATMLVSPSVHLEARGPTEALQLGPCAAGQADDPGDERCQACGRCTGEVLALDLSGTTADARFMLEIGLLDRPPRGVAVFLDDGDQTRLRKGGSMSVEHGAADTSLILLVCANRCPAGGTFDPGFTLVLEADGGPVEGPQRVEVPIPLQVKASGLWTCWGRTILLVLLILLVLTVIYGFLRPLRFPRKAGQGSHGFPWGYQAVTAENLDQLPELGTRPVRRYATRFTWYRNQVVYIEGDGKLGRDPRKAVVEIRLQRRHGVPRAWIRCLSGELIHTPYSLGMSSLPRRRRDWTEVPAEGAPLVRDALYCFKGDSSRKLFRFM